MSGVCICSCHGCFILHSIADFQNHATMIDKTKIADRQHRLARRIRAVHSKDFHTLSQHHHNVDDNDSGIRINLLNFHDENPSGEEDGDDVMELDDE